MYVMFPQTAYRHLHVCHVLTNRLPSPTCMSYPIRSTVEILQTLEAEMRHSLIYYDFRSKHFRNKKPQKHKHLTLVATKPVLRLTFSDVCRD
jgi:hypothetical protein